MFLKDCIKVLIPMVLLLIPLIISIIAIENNVKGSIYWLLLYFITLPVAYAYSNIKW
jgi:hypothetical protein